jgi:L-histidine Nalpha-methyltransferase
VIAHEHPHNETLFQLLQMIPGYEPVETDFAAGASPFKELPPKYFYDERGSHLFEETTELPEY